MRSQRETEADQVEGQEREVNGANVVVMDVIDTSKPGIMGVSLHKMDINREAEAKKRAELMEIEGNDDSIYSPTESSPKYSPGDSANWGSVVKDWEKTPTSSMVQSPAASEMSAKEIQHNIQKITGINIFIKLLRQQGG